MVQRRDASTRLPPSSDQPNMGPTQGAVIEIDPELPDDLLARADRACREAVELRAQLRETAGALPPSWRPQPPPVGNVDRDGRRSPESRVTVSTATRWRAPKTGTLPRRPA
jgi:hypothetical protein